MTARFVRSADFAGCPGFAVAANISFDRPRSNDIALAER
jgi:hypothetical protein